MKIKLDGCVYMLPMFSFLGIPCHFFCNCYFSQMILTLAAVLLVCSLILYFAYQKKLVPVILAIIAIIGHGLCVH